MAPVIEFTVEFNAAASRDRLIAWARANFDEDLDNPLTNAQIKKIIELYLRNTLKRTVSKWEKQQAYAAVPSIEN